jgi:chromosome segregation ATPase
MNGQRVLVGLTVVLAVVGLSACAKAPQEAIDQVQAAIAAAEQAEAPTYAPEAWETAQQALNQATAEIEAQNAKFALTRSYKQASEMLAKAQQSAADAQDQAIANKEQMRLEVEGAIASIEENLAAADGLLESLATCRRRPKGFAGDLEMMRGNVDGLRAQLADVQAKAAEESFAEAKSMAGGLLEGLNAAVSDMENVKAKIGC